MKILRILFVLPVLYLSCAAANAQIMEPRTINGTHFLCMRSGLYSDLSDCGFRSDWYAYVFVGSIRAVKHIGKYDYELNLVPEEVFSGAPSPTLTVQTSQGVCFPPLKAGDRWLFYLRKESNKPIVLDYYGNDSKPLTRAQNEVETLSHLQHIGNFGLIRGVVDDGGLHQGKPTTSVQVFARHQGTQKDYIATTDSRGRYEFPPLPPGDYKLTVSAISFSKNKSSDLDLKSKSCWDLRLPLVRESPTGNKMPH